MNLPIALQHLDEDYLQQLAAMTLLALMRDISEEHYCAGWLNGLEFSLWRIVQGESDRRFGMDEIPEERVHLLRLLSKVADGWWQWPEKFDEPQLVRSARWAAVCSEDAAPPPAQPTDTTDAKCDPCAGSGKRHSLFDPCACVPQCIGLGMCWVCRGTGKNSAPAAEEGKAR